MRIGRLRRRSVLTLALVAATTWPLGLAAWGPQGHRLVATIAERRLTAPAKQNVAWLLDGRPLSDVSSWADDYRTDNSQTALWHYLDIPPGAAGYDRDRDCPRQADVTAGSRGDQWRDCAVDRITYHQRRLANTALDRSDRAIALKFLVHLVGDLHQPFHALGVEQGGNGIPVSAFGAANCASAGAPIPCNLHSVWDSALIAHRQLTDRQYVEQLEGQIRQRGWAAVPIGSPAEWATQSYTFAMAALLSPHADADEAYYRAQIRVIDERLAMGGLRLAGLLNQSLTAPPGR